MFTFHVGLIFPILLMFPYKVIWVLILLGGNFCKECNIAKKNTKITHTKISTFTVGHAN